MKNTTFRLRHTFTGNEGVFVKEYTPTGGKPTIQIRLDNGEIYFAPRIEFKIA